MQNVSHVVYRDMDSSTALTSIIDKKLEKLARISDQISASRVVLETPHQHQHKGKLFRAQIELDVKGAPITLHKDNASIHIAVRDLFKAAERKLKEASSKQMASKKRLPAAKFDSPEPDEELH